MKLVKNAAGRFVPTEVNGKHKFHLKVLINTNQPE